MGHALSEVLNLALASSTVPCETHWIELREEYLTVDP